MKTRTQAARLLPFVLLAASPWACAKAGARSSAHLARGGSVASAFAPPAATEDEGATGTSASALLERALDALQNDRPGPATAALRAALATGDLNEAGRTVAYWYLYVAEQARHNAPAARDALADFVAVAEDVLAMRHDERFAEAGGSDFVDRFDLEGRLARSRATLSLAWAERVPGYGRDATHAVPVQNAQEMAFFLELAPPCAHRLEVRATEQVLAGGHITQVELSCEGLRGPARYYFNNASEAAKAAPLAGARNAARVADQ